MIVYDEDGNIKEIHCTYDPKLRGSGFNAVNQMEYSFCRRTT